MLMVVFVDGIWIIHYVIRCAVTNVKYVNIQLLWVNVKQESHATKMT